MTMSAPMRITAALLACLWLIAGSYALGVVLRPSAADARIERQTASEDAYDAARSNAYASAYADAWQDANAAGADAGEREGAADGAADSRG